MTKKDKPKRSPSVGTPGKESPMKKGEKDFYATTSREKGVNGINRLSDGRKEL